LNSEKDYEESCGDAVDLGDWRTWGCTLIGDSLNRDVDVTFYNVQALADFLQNKQTKMREIIKTVWDSETTIHWGSRCLNLDKCYKSLDNKELGIQPVVGVSIQTSLEKIYSDSGSLKGGLGYWDPSAYVTWGIYRFSFTSLLDFYPDFDISHKNDNIEELGTDIENYKWLIIMTLLY